MNVFTIIVTHNGMRRNWIRKCFSSLKTSVFPTQIIAIDNRSTDNTVEFINEEYPDVILIEAAGNLGFGKANNIGIEIALKNNADYVFLLNQDARVKPDTIQKLILKLDNNAEFGILSPMHLNGTGSALDYNFSRYINPGDCKSLYSDYVLNKVGDRIYESNFVCAAAWLISRNCLEVVGGFNPTFFHYGEDDNYVQRLHYKGLKIGVDPFSFIYHDREDRGPGPHQDHLKVEERVLLLKYSDPNIQSDIAADKKHFKRMLMKSKLLNQSDSVSYLRHKITVINEHKNKITENLAISKSEQKFSFLKLDSN